MPPFYRNDWTEALSNLRMLGECYPQVVHGDAHELARLLRCPKHEVEEAQRWMLEDGLEVLP